MQQKTAQSKNFEEHVVSIWDILLQRIPNIPPKTEIKILRFHLRPFRNLNSYSHFTSPDLSWILNAPDKSQISESDLQWSCFKCKVKYLQETWIIEVLIHFLLEEYATHQSLVQTLRNLNESKIGLAIPPTRPPPQKKERNIAKGTTDPGVDCFDQLFWFGRFGSVCLIG